MKLTKLLALLLMGAMLTACDVGQPISDESGAEKQTTLSEKITSPSDMTTTAGTTSLKDLISRCPCGALLEHVVGDNLVKLLQGKTNLNQAGKIDRDSLHVKGECLAANEGVDNLFDGTDAQWTCERKDNVKYTDEEGFIWVLFSTTEAVTVSSYVLTAGQDIYYQYNDQSYTTANPIEWILYGTNDPALFSAEKPSREGWMEVDYVYDATMHEEDGVSYGFIVDEEYQAPYQYYMLVFCYTSGTRLYLSELELYTAE